jgi:hypothetical protein
MGTLRRNKETIDDKYTEQVLHNNVVMVQYSTVQYILHIVLKKNYTASVKWTREE